MYIIGLSGAIGSGKSTLAEFLAAQSQSSKHWETWFIIAEVAAKLREQSVTHPKPDDLDAINEWLDILPSAIISVTQKVAPMEAFQLDMQKLSAHPEDYLKLLEYLEIMQQRPELQTATITDVNKNEVRSILQWLGGYLVKTVDPVIWYDEIVRRILSTQDIELATVGGVRYPADAERLKRAGGLIITIERPSTEQRDIADLTERERSLIKPDIVVHNNGSLEQLQVVAQQIYHDFSNGIGEPQYNAVPANK